MSTSSVSSPASQPGTGQVRIRVHAAPVHPVDIATRAGRLAEHGLMAASGDVGLGGDLAGVVDALSSRLNVEDVSDDVREAWIAYLETNDDGTWVLRR